MFHSVYQLLTFPHILLPRKRGEAESLIETMYFFTKKANDKTVLRFLIKPAPIGFL